MAGPTNTQPSGAVLTYIGEFVKPSPLDYQAIAASQTDKALGASGGKIGDYLSHIVIVVATAANSAVDIQDGGDTAISVFPDAPGSGIGTYTIPLGLQSRTGAWSVTTDSGVTAIAVGKFS